MPTDTPPPQPESGHVHAAIPEAVTALSAARTDHTKPLSVCHSGVNENPHESRGSSGVKLYLFAGIGKKPHHLMAIFAYNSQDPLLSCPIHSL